MVWLVVEEGEFLLTFSAGMTAPKFMLMVSPTVSCMSTSIPLYLTFVYMLIVNYYESMTYTR